MKTSNPISNITYYFLLLFVFPFACQEPVNDKGEMDQTCGILAARVDTHLSLQKEGVFSIQYELEQKSSEIFFTTFDENENEIGRLHITYSLPTTLSEPFETHLTYENEDEKAEEITRSIVSGAIIRNETINRSNDKEIRIWWSRGADGRVIDATAGVKIAADQNSKNAYLLEGDYYELIQYAKGGKLNVSEEELGDFIARHNLKEFDNNKSFRRMQKVASASSWTDALNNHVTTCDSEKAVNLLLGQLCEQTPHPFDNVFKVDGLRSAFASGLEVSGALIIAGTVGTAAGGIAVAVSVAVVVYLVGNEIEAFVSANKKPIIGTGIDAVEKGVNALPGAKVNSNQASDFFLPGAAGSKGDPHLTNYDGLAFDLQSAGEFVLSQREDGEFEVQSRQVPNNEDGTCGNISGNTAFAIKSGAYRITLVESELKVEGKKIVLLPFPVEILPGLIAYATTEGVVFHLPTGEKVYMIGSSYYAQIYLLPNPLMKGKYRGIFGNANGNTHDDFEGTKGVLTPPYSWIRIHHEFVDKWRVGDSNTLFNYDEGQSSATFFKPDFPSNTTFIEDIDPKLQVKAKELCGDIANPIAKVNCILDLTCTGDESLVSSYRRSSAQEKADVFLPTIFKGWEQRGIPAAGEWKTEDFNSSVTQLRNGNPTFFVSPNNYFNTEIRGTFRVNTETDDDVIGFVFGYSEPDETIETSIRSFVIAWKKTLQGNVQEGIRLFHVEGDYRRQPENAFWINQIEDETKVKVKVLAEDKGEGKGWRTNRAHKFRLIYSEDRIAVWIDGIKRIDVSAANSPIPFETGRFGFYNYSQSDVSYYDFRVKAL